MLTLLIGTDWIANRDEIMRLLADDVTNKKYGRILIVPELISHDTERRLCDIAGDTTSRYAQVLSFTRLARRVADAAGHAARECLDNGGRVVAMASAARQLHSKLKAYAAVETRPEFLTGLVEAVDEFKRCCITPADLKAASLQTEGAFAQKLEELALLYESYDGVCQRGKRDPRDQMTWLLEELQDSSFCADHVFYIDGFPDFTRQHMAILEHLIRESAHVIVSVNCDRVDTSALAFQRTGETASELIRCAKNAGVEVSVRTVAPRNDSLQQVRNSLFQGKIEKLQDADKTLCVYRTQSVYQECVAAADRVMELVRSGVRYRDISIVCSDPAAYHGTIEMVFERCHIPMYLSGTEDILGKSVVRTVLAAMDTALGGFERQDVLQYLKSVLTPLELDVCDRLENYILLWNINGNGLLKQWDRHPGGLGQQWTDDDIRELALLNDARMTALEPLVELKKGFQAAENLGQQVEALYAFLEKIELSYRLDLLAKDLDEKGDNRNAQILNQLWEILLSALEQMHDVLGQAAWDAETFTRLFRLLLSQYEVGTIPAVLDAVTVGPTSAMRCQQSKHLLVLGVLEGSMPGYGSTTGILTDQERSVLRAMGVPLNGGAINGLQAAFYEIYGVFCGAEETICVSCPGGQSSFIYRRLAELSGGDSEHSSDLGTAFADKMEAGAFLVRWQAASVAKDLGIAAAYDEVFNQKNHELGSVDPEHIKVLYGTKLNLSASQIDRQAECRLSYFLKYGLRVRERETAEVNPAEFGTYVHSVLENTAREVKARGGFHKVSLEETVAIAKSFSDAYAQERFSQLDSQRISYLFQRNSAELELIVHELWGELRESGFEPVDFEVSFGAKGQMPAIQIPSQGMQAQLRGFVDRVDRWSDEQGNYFRVVDYKTGKKDFDYCDIFNGIGLQMLLYLFALEQEGEELLGDMPIAAGVQYFPARVPLVSADGLISDEEAAAAREKLWKRKGLLLAEDPVLDAMESRITPRRMPYTCKKDGTISGDIADREQFELLKEYVFRLLGKMVDDIASGCVTPNPYTRGSSHDACTFCPYGQICHAENITERRNYKAITAQKFWQDVESEVADGG